MRVYKVLLGLSTLSSFAFGLWPRPKELTTGTTPLRLSSDLSISLAGVAGAPSDLVDAVKRTRGYLKNDKLQALVPDRGSSSKTAVSRAKALRRLQLKYSGQGKPKSISEEAIAAIDTRDEAYTLTVPADGSDAVLTASSSLGLFRGLTTFGQIWYDIDGTSYTLQAPISIKDSPAYVRGNCTFLSC
jgi:hexosaminidase